MVETQTKEVNLNINSTNIADFPPKANQRNITSDEIRKIA